MKKFIYPSLILLASCSGPGRPAEQETIVYEYSASDPGAALSDVISSVTIVPMETTPASLTSSDDGLFIHGREYFFIDSQNKKNVTRFDAEGRFMNTIGTAGRAENEYAAISDSYPANGGIEIFSAHNQAIYSYSLDGRFIARKPFEFQVARRIVPAQGGGYLAYLGYDNGLMPERVVKTDDAGAVVEKYLPSDSKVLGMSETSAVFTPDGEDVLVREAFSRRILAIAP